MADIINSKAYDQVWAKAYKQSEMFYSGEIDNAVEIFCRDLFLEVCRLNEVIGFMEERLDRVDPEGIV